MREARSEKWKSNISLVASLISIFMNIAIGFFISPVIVKDLGVEANGFAQLANNFVSYATLLTVALNAMASRFVSVSYHKGEINKATEYYSSALLGNLFVTLILIFPAVALILNIDKVVSIHTTSTHDVKLLFTFVFLNFFINNIANVFNISTTVKNQHYLSSAITMLGAIIRITILVILFRCFNVRVFFVSLAALVVSVVSILEYYIVKRKLIPEICFSIKKFRLKIIKELIFSGIWSLLNKCGELLMTGFDLLLTNLFIGPIQMGIMSVAKTIPMNLISISTTISWNWYPKMTKEYAEGNIVAMIKTLDSSAKITSAISSLPIMIFTIFSMDFYKLWMPTQDAKLLSILSLLSLISYIFLSGSACVYNLFMIYNNLKVNSVSYLISACCSIFISYICAKYTKYGTYAIAGVSSIVVILRNLLFLLPYAAKSIELKWYSFYKYVFYNFICCIVVGGVSFMIKLILVPHDWMTFILGCFFSLISSAIVLFYITLNKEQRKYILNIGKNIKYKIRRGARNG